MNNCPAKEFLIQNERVLSTNDLQCVSKKLESFIKDLDYIEQKYPSGLNYEFGEFLKQKIQKWKESNEYLSQITQSSW